MSETETDCEIKRANKIFFGWELLDNLGRNAKLFADYDVNKIL